MKFCRDCQYCEVVTGPMRAQHFCTRPKPVRYNMVTGLAIPPVIRKCNEERNNPSWCSEAAFYFIGKQDDQPT